MRLKLLTLDVAFLRLQVSELSEKMREKFSLELFVLFCEVHQGKE